MITMNEKLRNILKELGLSNRIDVLRFLSCKPLNLVQIHRHFRENGCNISMSGLSRCLNALLGLDLVEKFSDGCYGITGLGLLFLDVVLRLERIVTIEELVDAIELMSVLPAELKIGLANLSKARAEHDVYSAMKEVLAALSNADSYGKYICRAMDCDTVKNVVENCIRGVQFRIIYSREIVDDRIETIRGLADLKKIEKNLKIKVLDLPLQLGVIDGRFGFFQILKSDKATPVFLSNDRDFIEWVEMVFDHFWKIAKPVKLDSCRQ